jgi:hypothetical protein
MTDSFEQRGTGEEAMDARNCERRGLAGFACDGGRGLPLDRTAAPCAQSLKFVFRANFASNQPFLKKRSFFTFFYDFPPSE